MASFEQVIWDQVQSALVHSPSEEQTLESIKLSLLLKVSQILGLPLDPDDFHHRISAASRIVLSPQTLSMLDTAWNKIVMMYSDTKISISEKAIRESVLSKAPFFTERKCLVRFINVLSVKDSSITKILKTNILNILLAVDGFRGILPPHYKKYVDHLSDRLSERDQKHIAGVRAMYHYIDSKQPMLHNSSNTIRNPSSKLMVFSSGTATACRVFLALSNLFQERVGCRIDDTSQFILDKYIKLISKFIDREKENHCHLYPHLLTHEENIRKRLKKMYQNSIKDLQELDAIAFEKLMGVDKSLLLLMSAAN